MVEEDTKRKKRIVLICTSSFLLVAMVVAVTVGMNNSGAVTDKNGMTTTVKAVKTFCNPTVYKKECEESLMSEVGSTTDSRELMKFAFNITVKNIKKGLEKTRLLQQVEKDPRAKLALRSCKQLMDLSIGEIQRSLDGVTSFDLNNLESILVSIRVWLTGAMTYQETCLDSFANITSEAGTKMKSILKVSRRMSANALDVITDLEKAVKDVNVTRDERRLIDDYNGPFVGEQVIARDDVNEVPNWVGDGSSAGVRRLLQVAQNKLKANVVVAQDGSGRFRTINEALKLVPVNGQKPFVIYIKAGVYHEYVDITILMTNVVLVGDGPKKTILTGNKNMVDGIPTYATPTLAVGADFFVAMSIGIENSAGPLKDQACALRVQGDKAIFYQCSVDGYQDTLYAHTMRQFYRDCSISGTIDFVFGNAQAVFQNCTFVVRKPLDHQQCIIVAQARAEENQPSGIIIQNSRIVSEFPNAPVTYKAYIGRPWKHYARTIVMDSFIGDVIQPEGYMPWEEPDKRLTGMDTCFYAEVNNTGPGSDKSRRVKWLGIRNLSYESAKVFSPSLFFQGDDWIKNTKIPYLASETSPIPKATSPTPNPTLPKATPPTLNPTLPTATTTPPTPNPTLPTSTPPTPNPTLPNATPPTPNPTLPTTSPPTPNPTLPDPTLPTPNPTLPQATPPIPNPTLPTTTPSIPNPTLPTATPPTPNPALPEPTLPTPEPTLPKETPSIPNPTLPTTTPQTPNPTLPEPTLPTPNPTLPEPTLPTPNPTLPEPTLPTPKP